VGAPVYNAEGPLELTLSDIDREVVYDSRWDYTSVFAHVYGSLVVIRGTAVDTAPTSGPAMDRRIL
jgi:hypothetical protein